MLSNPQNQIHSLPIHAELTFLHVHFIVERTSRKFLLTTKFFLDIPAFNGSNVDPGQTPRSVTSDLGLHICLPTSLFVDASHQRLEVGGRG